MKRNLYILHSETRQQFVYHLFECYVWAHNAGYCKEYDFSIAKEIIPALSWKQIHTFLLRQNKYSTAWEVVEDFNSYCEMVLCRSTK